MEYILRTNNLTKQYQTTLAVDNVSMNIKKGDIYGFVGKNGAGKTTLIRLITGLANKTSGTFELYGTLDSGKINEARRRMAAIVENPSIYLNMNAYNNLLMQCKILGIVDEESIIDNLKLVGLPYNKKDKKVAKNYSLGMRQRLGIAVSLIGNPDFIILDEPTNGLDPEGIIEIRELLIKLNTEKNITILISSHILGELSKLATCYGFINDGKLIQEISATKLMEQCKRCVKISVNTTKNISPILESKLNLKNYKILNDKEINIFDEGVEISKIVSELSKNDISVDNIFNQNEDLEGYFINLVGGKH